MTPTDLCVPIYLNYSISGSCVVFSFYAGGRALLKAAVMQITHARLSRICSQVLFFKLKKA